MLVRGEDAVPHCMESGFPSPRVSREKQFRNGAHWGRGRWPSQDRSSQRSRFMLGVVAVWVWVVV